MSVMQIIDEAAAVGIRLEVEGGKLIVEFSGEAPDGLLARLKKHKAEIVEILRQGHTATNPASPAPVGMPEAAAEMERETYRRLPEVRAAAGLPPVSSASSLKEQGDYCATRGMDYLADFWANLTREERVSVGGRAALDAWKKLARAARDAEACATALTGLA